MRMDFWNEAWNLIYWKLLFHFFRDLLSEQQKCSLKSFQLIFLRVQGSISPSFNEQLLRTKIPKAQKDSQIKQLFALLGPACVQAAPKHVDEIDPSCSTCEQKCRRFRARVTPPLHVSPYNECIACLNNMFSLQFSSLSLSLSLSLSFSFSLSLSHTHTLHTHSTHTHTHVKKF